MAQHALGLGLISGCNREVFALQRCKRYGPACIGTWTYTWLHCNREVNCL